MGGGHTSTGAVIRIGWCSPVNHCAAEAGGVWNGDIGRAVGDDGRGVVNNSYYKTTGGRIAIAVIGRIGYRAGTHRKSITGIIGACEGWR